MTLIFTRGDILQARVDAVVNPVNCVGVMGRGLAAQFKREYPENFKAYALACKREEVMPGKMFVFETGRLCIMNFPTKRHWRDKSHIEDIESGLVALASEVRLRRISSIAIPPIGCGLGGLDWSDILPRIRQTFAALPGVHVSIFEPAEPDNAATFWESVERTAKEVRTWPSWEQAGVVVDPVNFVTFMPDEEPADTGSATCGLARPQAPSRNNASGCLCSCHPT